MHPALKIIVGALMVIVGVYSSVTFLDELVTLIQAGIGPLLVVIGAFIVWLESDEWKMRREQDRDKGVQQQFQKAEPTEPEPVTEEPDPEPEEDEGNTCGQCGKTFDTERGLHIHQAQKHE
jgi:hypothetical protein